MGQYNLERSCSLGIGLVCESDRGGAGIKSAEIEKFYFGWYIVIQT